MARGNQGQVIFRDDEDRQRFLAALGDACGKTGWRIHAYVLMGNHYHLLVETPEGNLVAGMKWLQGVYTQRHNRRHQASGHLFQGRYKAVPVDASNAGYLETVSTYIHLNPARAGLIRIGQQRLKHYPWSSYRWYLAGDGVAPAWLCKEQVLGNLRLKPSDRRGYEAYMEARTLELAPPEQRQQLECQWKDLRRGWYVGSDDFPGQLRQRLKKASTGRQAESHSGGAKREHGHAAAEQWLVEGLAALGLQNEDLGKMPMSAPEKIALAGWLRERTTASLRWIGRRLAMGHYTNVSHGERKLTKQNANRAKQCRHKLNHLRSNA